jgi:hypothetical protein
MRINSFIAYIFSFSILTLVGNMASAQKLHGKFFLENSEFSGPRYLTFMNGKFADTLYGHVQNDYGLGRYHISRRKLALTYEKIPNQDSSTYTIKSSSLSSREGKLSTRLYLDGEPRFGVVLFRDQHCKLLKTIKTNDRGLVDLVIPDDKDLETVEILGYFYYPIIISKEQLLGKSTEIEVHFRDAEKYYIPPATIIYEIRKLRRDKLILYSDKDRELVFSRAPSGK